MADHPGPEIEGFLATTVDHLFVLIDDSSPDLRDLVDWARRGIRSGRPAVDWVFPDEISVALRRLKESVISPEVAGLVSDILAAVEQPKDAFQISRRHGLSGSPRTSRAIEFAQFRVTQSFSEVEKKLGEHIESKDTLGLLLRRHLWIEASINGLLDRTVADSSALSDARLSFSQQVALAVALGQLDSSQAAVIRKLNKMRNKVAHDLDSNITDADQKELVSLCSAELRHIAGGGHDLEFPDGVTAVITALVVIQHGRADEFDAEARHDKWHHQRAERVLQHYEAGSRTMSASKSERSY